jgi:hypothetical protein
MPSLPMPTAEHAFSNFHNAKIFSVLELNSAYYQIPLSSKSHKAKAFCVPFGLFEFTTLPIGISVGWHVLSQAVDSLFGDVETEIYVQLYGQFSHTFQFLH